MNIQKLISGIDAAFGVWWSESQGAFQVKPIGEERMMAIAAYITKRPLADYRLMGFFTTENEARQFINIISLRRTAPNS